MLTDDMSMAYFDPWRRTKLKTDAGPGGMATTIKQYDAEAKRWQPVINPHEHLWILKADKMEPPLRHHPKCQA